MMKSSRVATITRESTSRPSWSVPNQCAAEGPFSACAVLLASGSYGTTSGPNTAAIRISANRKKAKPVTGFSPMT